MFNLVVLTGRLCSDVELKTTPNGVSVCLFSIAVDRPYRKGQEKQADFFNIVAWRGMAEFVTKNFSKGNAIGIEGSIQTRQYQDKEGHNRKVFEIIANNVHFVERKKDTSQPAENIAPSYGISEGFEEMSADDELPF